MARGNTLSFAFLTVLAIAAVSGAAAPAAQAAVTTDGSSATFTASATDLLQTSRSGVTGTVDGVAYTGGVSAVGVFTHDGAIGGEPALRDGVFGSPSGKSQTAISACIRSGAVATYLLDLGASPQGYVITQIDTYSSWDEGRDRADYTVSYATVAAPTTFVDIITISWDPSPNPWGKVSITPDAPATFLATGVKAVRFTFANQENGAAGYRELDVFGYAVPEPATLALAAVGGLGLAAARRRK